MIWITKRFGLFLGRRWLGIAIVLILAGCAKQSTKPNVLLITLDTLRADALGCYGNTKVQTATLDRIAKEGIVFEDAMCQIPATLTSHTAMMTGRNPKTTGVRFRTGRVSVHEETLAERFQSRGYDTAAFLGSYVLAPEFGLNQGFDRYEMGSMVRQNRKISEERRAEETIQQTIAFLDDPRPGPFFIWLHLYDAHSPYDPPAPFSTLYDPHYTGTIRGSVAEITRLNASHGEGLNEADRHHLRALYEGEVTYMDRQIASLLATLEEKRILDNTVLAIIADHGENLGEGGRFFHGDDLYQPSIHIPFLIRYPKRIAAGLRISQSVQSIDLFPTLLELADIPMISGVEGTSLVPLFDDSNRAPGYSSKPGYLETEADPLTESNKLHGLRTETHKFLFHSAHRRSDVPLGVFTEIPLKGPSIILARVWGDSSVRLMAHIRYRTELLYQSRDMQALSALNTTVIHAETVGVESLHQDAMNQKNFFPTPEGWRLQMTPDLYRLARDYGQSQGWPVEWMVIEGVGVDASFPLRQREGTFSLDQIELYAPSLRFPNISRFRNPFWVIEDFEQSNGLVDSGEGSAHSMKSEWENHRLFDGQRQQKITVTFQEPANPDTFDELYDLKEDEREEVNLVGSNFTNNDSRKENEKIAATCRQLLQSWISKKGNTLDIQPLDAAQLEALQSLGYSR